MIVAVTSMLPAVSIAARLERVPLLVYCGELFDRGYGVGRVRALAGRELARLTGRLASGLIACSQVVARQFDQLPPGTVEVVYPPHDERYRQGRRQARAGAGTGSRPMRRVCVSVGYLTEGRGQDVLIRAMPEILAEFPDAHYVIVGDPFPRPQDLAYRQYLVGLIAQLRLQGSITLAGPPRGRRGRLRGGRRDRQPGALQRALRPRPVRGGDRRQAGRRHPGRSDPGAARRRRVGADRRARRALCSWRPR